MECVFVDLRAVYPSPEEPGTELSFEEIWATNRGWLGQSWHSVSAINHPHDNRLPVAAGGKVVVHSDVVTLDENGRIPEPHCDGRGRKKKVMEVNETQISKSPSQVEVYILILQQSKQSSTLHLARRYARVNTHLNLP